MLRPQRPIILPPKPVKGQFVTTEWAVQLLDALAALDARTRDLRLTGGNGIRVATLAPGAGQVVELVPQAKPVPDHPFKVRWEADSQSLIVARGIAGTGRAVLVDESSPQSISGAGIYHIYLAICDSQSSPRVEVVCQKESEMTTPTPLGNWRATQPSEMDPLYDADRWENWDLFRIVAPVAVVKMDDHDGTLVPVIAQYLRSDLVLAAPMDMVDSDGTNAMHVDVDSRKLYADPP